MRHSHHGPDLGRRGYQRYGVPQSGALDSYALRVGNLLVGNPEGAAGLEMTLAGQAAPPGRYGPGRDRADLRGPPQRRPPPALARRGRPCGAILSFADVAQGMRAYLAVAGGIDVPPVMGSRSTYLRARLGGLEGGPCAPATISPRRGGSARPGGGPPPARRGRAHPPALSRPAGGPGPHTDAFEPQGLQAFLVASLHHLRPVRQRPGTGSRARP